ncbi:MAG: PHP-associated domain-containing protein [Dehalococcoidia bacterium]
MPETIDKRRSLRETEYGLADVHIHSSVGDGMADIPEIITFVQEKTDLDVIAITDHNRIKGSYQARELAAKRGYRFEVVIGTEVTTLEGHLLGLFIESPIPYLQSLENTIEAIHKQGGLCIVPHPMSWLTQSVSKQNLERVMANSDLDVHLDGVETINATIVGRISNKRARKFNRKYQLAETGGSDAHFLIAVGGAITLFPGRTAEELKRSLLERTTQARNGIQVKNSDIGFLQIIRQQRKSKGLSFHGMLRNIKENFL